MSYQANIVPSYSKLERTWDIEVSKLLKEILQGGKIHAANPDNIIK